MKKEDRKVETLVQFLMPSTLTIVLFVFYTLLIGTFFFLLDKKTDEGFGFSEIAFSFAGAFLWTSFTSWIKSIISKNPYLGLIIGFMITVLLAYALFIRFKGPNTLVFAALGALATIGYFVYTFFNARSEETKK